MKRLLSDFPGFFIGGACIALGLALKLKAIAYMFTELDEIPGSLVIVGAMIMFVSPVFTSQISRKDQ